MGNPEWATEEIFQDRVSRGQNMDVLKVLMSDWLGTWKVQDLYREAQSRRIPFAPINTMQQLYENEHLAARKFFVEFNQPGVGTLTLPGAPSQYSTINCSLRRPARRSANTPTSWPPRRRRGRSARRTSKWRTTPTISFARSRVCGCSTSLR
jgi:crotonobetainyl-CoA:carnitine CoA-transferase CaiB-like acyl-CoA transferase